MTFTLIKGHYYIVGYSPDGDSLKFKADDPALWDRLASDNQARLVENLAADNGIVMLRLQGVDAFETHYSPENPPAPADLKKAASKTLKKPEAGEYKQPKYIALQATNYLLGLLGIESVAWKSWGRNSWVDKITVKDGKKTVEIKEKYADAFPGYIVTDDVEKNGRPLAWVFPGTTRSKDGAALTTEQLEKIVDQSANYRLLETGLVYPYFFMTLPAKLRNKLMAAAKTAQEAAAAQLKQYAGKTLPPDLPNLWLYDQTIRGINVDDLKNITDDYGLYPYLFRRIIKHWYRTQMERYWDALRQGKDDSPAYDLRVNFDRFFDEGNPYVFVISDQDFVRLDSIVTLKGNKLTFTRYPYDLVFLS